MSQYTMFVDNADTVSLKNLTFKLRYPLYKTVNSALKQFHGLQQIVETTPKTDANRDFIFGCLNECDFILNILEGYDL